MSDVSKYFQPNGAPRKRIRNRPVQIASEYNWDAGKLVFGTKQSGGSKKKAKRDSE